MKKLLLTAKAILATLNMYGQETPYGIINFSNLGRTAEDRVYVSADGSATGATTPAGSAYNVALYWGPAGATTDANFIQAGSAVTFAATGQFGGGNRTISPLAANGDTVSIQVRGWATAGGARSWEEAIALRTEAGKSAWFDMKTKDPTDTLPAPTLGLQTGWAGFGISPVPEPSVIGLGLLGAGALLMLRRRK